MIESQFLNIQNKDLSFSQSFVDIEPLFPEGKIKPNLFTGWKDGKKWILKISSDALIQEEYQRMRNIQHPFIVFTFFYAEKIINNKSAIVMEYIDGRTLTDFLKEKHSFSTKRKILNQILDATEYLHSKGLLHNDLKPDNIMISSIGNDVKIIDFGLYSTYGFSAPEIFNETKESNIRATADIYSIGKIINCLFPKKYRKISKKCCNLDPSKRFQDVNDLRIALEKDDKFPWGKTFLLLIIIAILSIIFHNFYQTTKLKRVRNDMEQIVETYLDSMQNDEYCRYQEDIDYYEFMCIDETKKYATQQDDYFSNMIFYDTIFNNLKPLYIGIYHKLFSREDSTATKEMLEFYSNFDNRFVPRKKFNK